MSRHRVPPLLIFFAALVALLQIFLLFAQLALRPARMIGASMDPTIPADSIFLAQTVFLRPKQGDILVFQVDSFINEPMVKRVIATGGQHVTVDLTTGTVSVDGQILDEPYVTKPMTVTSNPNMTLLDVTVPEGSIYVMGDNRNHSVDSRDQRLGTVELSAILGKALFLD